MIISVGTVISSLLSDRLLRTLGTGKMTAISVAATAIAIFGISISDSFLMLCLWAIPYGLGAGCVGAGLNNYVAVHYSSTHMSWLHCMWGLGATIGPYVMGYMLSGGYHWTGGYRIIGVFQVVITIVLFFTLPLWEKEASKNKESILAPLLLKELTAIRQLLLPVCFL